MTAATLPRTEARYIWTPAPVVAVNEVRMLTYHVGGHGDVAFPLHIVARAGQHEITEHRYGNAIERHCSCAEFEPSRPCAHVVAYERQRVTRPVTAAAVVE